MDERTQRMTNLLFTAEMENLLTHENLLAYQKYAKRFAHGGAMFVVDDKKVYSLMGLRHGTLHMRFGNFPLDVEMLFDFEHHLQTIVSLSGKRVRAFQPSDSSDQDRDRIEALRCRLMDALDETRHGKKLAQKAEQDRRESDDARRSAYGALTGDNRFHQW